MDYDNIKRPCDTSPMQCDRRSGVGGAFGRGLCFTLDAALKTDLQSALDQIEGHHGCVCGATAQNPTKSTKEEILL